MTLPEPLPGTHLARVDCIDCGQYVLAVPKHADRARCTGCGREAAEALTRDASGPPGRPDQSLGG